MAKKVLDDAKVDYKCVDAEKDVDLTLSYGIKQAPTLVVIKNGEVELIKNISNIKKFVNENVVCHV